MNSIPSLQKNFCALRRVCAVYVCACLCLINCFYLCVDWIHESASVCSRLCCLWATCLLPRLLLRSRDKAHWCLSAPWQITEADRYKDSGRQLYYIGGQRRSYWGCLSWPQHQSNLNIIWLLHLHCWCWIGKQWIRLGNIFWNIFELRSEF